MGNHDCHKDGCQPFKKVIKKQQLKKKKKKNDDEEDEEDKPTLRFKNYRHLLEKPVYIVVDFESSLIAVEDVNDSNTRKVDKHVINSWCFSIQSKYDLGLEQETFMYVKTDESETEDTVISRFLETLQRQVRNINLQLHNLEQNKFYTNVEYEANREA